MIGYVDVNEFDIQKLLV